MKTRASHVVRWILDVLLVIGLLAGSVATATIVDAQPASPDQGAAGPQAQDGSTIDLSEYWTIDRMQAAIPYDVIPSNELPQAEPQNPAAQTAGEPGWIPSQAPDDFTGTLVPTGEAGTYPAPAPTLNHTTDYVPTSDILTFPFRAAGKIFFTMLGRNYVCSGAVIGENAVWTAGHCVSNGRGTFHSNWVFVPGFDNYASPYPGPWTVSYYVAPIEFTRNMDLSYDYAIVGVTPPAPANGRSLRSYIGALGFAWNMPRAQNWKLLGYPMINYNGLQMVYSDSTYYEDNTTYSPASMGVGSAIKSGGSGGPWILNFNFNQAGQGNYLNGVNSYINLTRDEIFSPYLDDRAKQLWDCSRNTAPALDWSCFETSAISNLVLTYAPGSDPATPGVPFSYRINIYNPGPSDATGMVLTDALENASFSMVSADLPGGNCTVAGSTATCNLDSLAAGATASATFGTSPLGLSFLSVVNRASITFAQQEKWDVQVAFITEEACLKQFTVTNTNDSGAGSLREAIASVCLSGAVVNFDPGLSGGVIHLETQLEVDGNDMTIDGSDLAERLTISGEGNVRVFNAPSTSLTLDSLIITRGQTAGTGGGINTSGLTLKNSRVTESTAGYGGGIYVSGYMHLVNSTIADNHATDQGGGIYFTTNFTGGTIVNSTIASNSAAYGGGMYLASAHTPAVTNSTISGNSASANGGGIYNQTGPLSLTNVTLSGNSAAGQGGGVFLSHDLSSTATLNYTNTIIANSASGGDCVIDGGTVGINTNNLVEDSSCSAALSGDPVLGPLADNGGPTYTINLLTGSPALDAGEDASCAATDQRGVIRPQSEHCDIGAFEGTDVDTVAPVLTLPDDITAEATRATGAVVTFSVTASDEIDSAPAVVCNPASGADFSMGDTTVTCTATDMGGNESSGSFTVTVVPYSAKVYYVKPVAAGAGDCSSWVNACMLQTALGQAFSGDEIWAAAGTYKPTLGTSRAATYQLVDGVAVYGGFAGTETARNQRDPAANLTILSGDLLGNDNDDVQSDGVARADNTYHVVIGASDATLDGFTITGGNANGLDCPGIGCGGGMYNDSGDPNLVNVIFNTNSTHQFGGGLYNYIGSPTLTHVTFSGNYANDDGGGMYNETGSNPVLTEVTFNNNSAVDGGGGIFNNNGSLILTKATLSGNTAAYGGGIGNNNELTLADSTLSGNSATGDGGGIENAGNLTVANSTLAGNTASGYGGGIDTYGGVMTLMNVTLSGNSAPNGGGVYNSATLDFANTIIANSDGGADCLNEGGTIGTNSHNLMEDGSCSAALGGDPLLGPLADNGGPTQTMALLTGSPAINNGDDAVCAAAPVNNLDQRGILRPQGEHCDIGAYEVVLIYRIFFPGVSH